MPALRMRTACVEFSRRRCGQFFSLAKLVGIPQQKLKRLTRRVLIFHRWGHCRRASPCATLCGYCGEGQTGVEPRPQNSRKCAYGAYRHAGPPLLQHIDGNPMMTHSDVQSFLIMRTHGKKESTNGSDSGSGGFVHDRLRITQGELII